MNSIPTGSLSKPSSYAFSDEKAYDFCMYSEGIYSGKISFGIQTKKNSVTQMAEFNYTFYFKIVNGEIKVYNMVNSGVSK